MTVAVDASPYAAAVVAAASVGIEFSVDKPFPPLKLFPTDEVAYNVVSLSVVYLDDLAVVDLLRHTPMLAVVEYCFVAVEH